MPEQWQDIASWEGMYQVSDQGRIRSFWKRKSLGVGKGSQMALGDKPTLMTLSQDRRGYFYVMFKNGKGRLCRYSVARLVLNAFVGPAPDGFDACHSPDPTPSNNRLANLKWGTHRENQQEMSKQGRVKSAKLDPDKVREIRRRLVRGDRQVDIAADFGVDQTMISDIKLGLTWSWVE